MIKIFFSEEAYQKAIDERVMFLTEHIGRLNKTIDDLVEQVTLSKHKKVNNFIKNKVNKKKK